MVNTDHLLTKINQDITEEITMKNIKKVITAAVAGLMAAAAIATTAGAAEYIGNDGSYWTDGIYDGKVYVENSYGWFVDLDDYYTYNSYSDYSGYNYDFYRYTSYYDEVFMGFDSYFGYVYYRADCGYYTYNKNNSIRYLGPEFTFTEYTGKDRYGNEIYYRSEFGYIYRSGNTWYTLGYNINNIAW